MKDIGRIKKAQLWLHNNYEVTRFWVAMVVAVIVVFTLMAQDRRVTEAVELNRKVIESQSQQLKSIINELKDDNERQTQLISCLLAIHGDSDSISTEDEARCRQEATQQIENNSQGVGSEGQPLTPDSAPPTSQQPSSSSQPQRPQEPTPPPDNDIPLVPEMVEDVLNVIPGVNL